MNKKFDQVFLIIKFTLILNSGLSFTISKFYLTLNFIAFIINQELNFSIKTYFLFIKKSYSKMTKIDDQQKSQGISSMTERMPAATDVFQDCLTMVSICLSSKYRVFLYSIDLSMLCISLQLVSIWVFSQVSKDVVSSLNCPIL